MIGLCCLDYEPSRFHSEANVDRAAVPSDWGNTKQYRNCQARIHLLHRIPFLVAEAPRHGETKKADVAEHPKVLNHVGLLFNEPPAGPSCSSSSHPTTSDWLLYRDEGGRQRVGSM